MPVLLMFCCQVEVSETGRSLIQRSHTDRVCVCLCVCVCVIVVSKLQQSGGPDPNKAVERQEQRKYHRNESPGIIQKY
jgi:hypothetical protein